MRIEIVFPDVSLLVGVCVLGARVGETCAGCAAFGLSLLAAGVAALYGLGVRALLTVLWEQGPTIQGYALRRDGAWVAPLILFPWGCSSDSR